MGPAPIFACTPVLIQLHAVTATSATSARTFVFQLQELVDLIIDLLSESLWDLRSCSLVSSVWVRRSQYHIFSRITFHFPTTQGEPGHPLGAILGRSPDPPAFIRKVSITLDLPTLSSFNQINWANLEEVTLNFQPGKDPETESIQSVQNILKLPTIRAVNISAANGSQSISTIIKYFENCSRRIDTLLISFPQSAVSPPICTPSTRVQKIKLSHLGTAPAFYTWLVSPACPFGVAHVKTADVWASEWSEFQRVLAPSLTALESLTLISSK